MLAEIDIPGRPVRLPLVRLAVIPLLWPYLGTSVRDRLDFLVSKSSILENSFLRSNTRDSLLYWVWIFFKQVLTLITKRFLYLGRISFTESYGG
jgi:hypothetical protein